MRQLDLHGSLIVAHYCCLPHTVFINVGIISSYLERFSIECRKNKTNVITLANHEGRRQSSEPIKARSNYM